MRVNCLGCGHMINLGLDYDDFKGQVRCNVCHSMTTIETKGGKIKSVRHADVSPPKPQEPERKK